MRRLYRWVSPQTPRERWFWRTGVVFGVVQGYRIAKGWRGLRVARA